MTIYGLPHLFQPGSETLIASKISICGLAESGFIPGLVMECESECLSQIVWVWHGLHVFYSILC